MLHRVGRVHSGKDDETHGMHDHREADDARRWFVDVRIQ